MHGLSSIEADKRLKQFGLNLIEELKRESVLKRIIDQLSNFLVILLIIAGVISFMANEYVDALLIFAIVIINAFFGIYQEEKAGQAIASLKKLTVNTIRVIRDGKQQEIESKFLVPGDIIFIEEGVKIPADAIVLETLNLEINESSLTGESLPVIKSIKDAIFMGTIVSKGRGYAEVTNTGMSSKFGTIAANLGTITNLKTPLQIKLNSLAKIIGTTGIVMSIAVFFISLTQGHTYIPAFLLSVSLAVAVVPEGLPAVMTVILSIGVKEMAKKKAIMRNLSAIEALGSITIIATDKTGTITSNQMKVKEIYSNKELFSVAVLPPIQNKAFQLLIYNGILCSTASLVYTHESKKYDVLGDPTEGALLYLAQDSKTNYEEVRKDWTLLHENPFNSETKIMSVEVKCKQDHLHLYKGAQESILNISSHILIDGKNEKLSESIKNDIESQAEKWAEKGLRIIAFSYSEKNNKEIIFLGMVAIHDPPRPEVKAAIEKANSAGINVVMITGDNEKTAEAIGNSVGLIHPGEEILTGDMLEEYSDSELLKILPKVRIFARTTPFHKSRIVKLYQQLGEIVAVTGDGVNDVIALKQAHVGIAMGLIGTDVARESADMVITDDNFASIVSAIEEGRHIIKKIQNAIKYLFATNLAEALTIIIGLLLQIPTLFFPIQILFINFISDGIPALALAFSPHEDQVMKRKPVKNLSLIKTYDYIYILTSGMIATIFVLVSFYIFYPVNIILGRTAAFSVLAMIQSFIFIDIWLSHRFMMHHLKHLSSIVFIIAFSLPLITFYILLTSPFIASIFRITTVPLSLYLTFFLISAAVTIPIVMLSVVIKRR